MNHLAILLLLALVLPAFGSAKKPPEPKCDRTIRLTKEWEGKTQCFKLTLEESRILKQIAEEKIRQEKVWLMGDTTRMSPSTTLRANKPEKPCEHEWEKGYRYEDKREVDGNDWGRFCRKCNRFETAVFWNGGMEYRYEGKSFVPKPPAVKPKVVKPCLEFGQSKKRLSGAMVVSNLNLRHDGKNCSHVGAERLKIFIDDQRVFEMPMTTINKVDTVWKDTLSYLLVVQLCNDYPKPESTLYAGRVAASIVTQFRGRMKVLEPDNFDDRWYALIIGLPALLLGIAIGKRWRRQLWSEKRG